MAEFNEHELEKRLLTLKDTQESISNLSSWCLKYPQEHKKIVTVWLQVLKKVKMEQRLILFYLANDVIQYSKRKGYNFVESWGTALQRATTMVRDDSIKHKILRLFKIWDERSIYDESFLIDLSGLLSSRKSSQNVDTQEFQAQLLIAKIRACKKLEDDTDGKLKIVNDSHLSLNDAEALHSSLKDRRHGADLEQEIDEGEKKLEEYILALKTEIKERVVLIELLEQGESFYELMRGDAKIVCNRRTEEKQKFPASESTSNNCPMLKLLKKQKKWASYNRKRKIAREISRTLKKLDKAVTSYNKYNRPQNEFDIFGKHVSAQLKTMPLSEALACENQIQTVMGNQRFELLEQTHHLNKSPVIPLIADTLPDEESHKSLFSVETDEYNHQQEKENLNESGDLQFEQWCLSLGFN